MYYQGDSTVWILPIDGRGGCRSALDHAVRVKIVVA